MNLDSLKILCDVARQRSFSRAAALNHVSQSAASQAVNQIEKQLGVRLFDRSKRPLELTSEGRVFYEGCRAMIDDYTALEERVRSFHETLAGNVTVASIYSVGLYDMNRYVQRFKAEHPKGEIRIVYLHPEEVYRAVSEEEADLGLVSFPRSSREFVARPWREEPMVLACCPDHHLAHATSLRLESLEGEPFVAFDQNLAIRREIDRALRQRGVGIRVVMEFDNIEAIKRGVEACSGVSILPRPTLAREIEQGTLVAVPLADAGLLRPLAILHRRGRELTVAMRDFVEILLSGEGEPPVSREAAAVGAEAASERTRETAGERAAAVGP